MTARAEQTAIKRMIEPAFDGRLPWDYRVFWPSTLDPAEVIVSVQDEDGGDWRDVRFSIALTLLK
jgi:hypothetical protein